MENVEWSLPVVFHFVVKVDTTEISFQEVSGLEVSLDTEEVRSGGDNSTVYHLPKRVKYSDIVLKRAMVSKDEVFYRWCKENLNAAQSNCRIQLKNVEISICDSEKKPLKTWSVIGAYPYKWSISNLDAMKNEIAVESVSLKFHSLSLA